MAADDGDDDQDEKTLNDSIRIFFMMYGWSKIEYGYKQGRPIFKDDS